MRLNTLMGANICVSAFYSQWPGAFSPMYAVSYIGGMDFAARVRAFLTSSGWGQANLAARIKVNQSTVSNWLRGAVPSHVHEQRFRELEQAFVKPESAEPHQIDEALLVDLFALALQAKRPLEHDDARALSSAILEAARAGFRTHNKRDPGKILNQILFDTLAGRPQKNMP